MDTGSETNLIKISSLKDGTEIDNSKTYSLAGISDQLINTLGQVTVNFDNITCKFNVVKDDFPILEEGILGVEFLKSEECTLSFPDQELHIKNKTSTKLPFLDYSTVYLPAKSKKVVTIKIKNYKEDVADYYIPRIQTG